MKTEFVPVGVNAATQVTTWCLRLTTDDGSETYLNLAAATALRQFLNNNREKLRPEKNWRECPYEGHHDSCDCKGMGGDR